MNRTVPGTERPPRVGGTETFPSGRLSFLSPKPLPTGLPAVDHAHAVGDVNTRYLDFGVGLPSAFGWQMVLGGPFGNFVLVAFVFPLIGMAFVFAHTGDASQSSQAYWELFDICIWLGFGAWCVIFLLGLSVWYNHHQKYKIVIPTRFNRQRREVCFVPKGHKEPIFVPWEELVAWVSEAQGVTEYGVQRQYGFGVGFYHSETGQRYTLEFQTYGLPQAVSSWEAIRAYMEYEVHTLKEVQDPLELQGPDDPPWEGVHVFRNARQRLHDEYRDGRRGLFYLIGWYLYHLMTFWTIPNRLVEWEVKKIMAMNRKALPKAMSEWSESIPEDQWATPSEELKRQSKRVLELKKSNPETPITKIFAQVTEESGAGASIIA